MSYAKHTRSSQRSSFQTPLNIPISAFNKEILDEARRISKAQDKGITPSSNMNEDTSRNSRRSRDSGVKGGHGQLRHKSTPMSAKPGHEVLNVQKGKVSRWSVSEQSPKTHYIRPTGSELVCSRVPSCIGLPSSWTYIHDRFIAYLATHAPLDRNGKVPKHEERKERWKSEDIVKEVSERFPELGRNIKVTMIEKRLALLDLAGDNDYFKIPYGAYMYEEWGQGI